MARDQTRVNKQIKVPEVRVVDTEGNQLGVMSVGNALEAADDKGLDLVEVAPQAKPPVCRIMDYGKFKYEQSKKAKEAKKKQATVQLKEVKFKTRTDEHDYQFKYKNIKKFLGEGNKVKVTIMFRGREVTHPEVGRRILDRIIEELGDEVVVEARPRMEGRNMTMMVSPVTQK